VGGGYCHWRLEEVLEVEDVRKEGEGILEDFEINLIDNKLALIYKELGWILGCKTEKN